MMRYLWLTLRLALSTTTTRRGKDIDKFIKDNLLLLLLLLGRSSTYKKIILGSYSIRNVRKIT